MPYKQGARLPGEKASKLGHLDVIRSELVKKLIAEFEDKDSIPELFDVNWEEIKLEGEPLSFIFSVDGSIQTIEYPSPPYKRIAFVKTALLRIDEYKISKIDKESPHPLALKDILSECAIYHATIFPLRHVTLPTMNTYDTVRHVIYDSINDPNFNGEIMETLKWLAYRKWASEQNSIPLFGCPHCEESLATLPYDTEEGSCPNCGGHLFITDMLGFHLDMLEDLAPNTIASTYMSIHETLLLFTGIRILWETNKKMLKESLFIKDGPLSIRAQYSKLVEPIRRFLAFAKENGCPIHIIGQEKSGRFYEHLELISRNAPLNHLFIPNNKYIKEEIQQRPNTGYPYGKDTNYGAKVFLKLNHYHHLILNIPTGRFIENPDINDLIGIDRILSTLPKILSNRFEGALLPIELANGIASLSTYPSAQILKIFLDNSKNIL